MEHTERWRYLYSLLPEVEPIVIADIGANPINPSPYQALLDAGLCYVYGFEPNEDAYNKLVKDKSEHEVYFNAAIGPKGPGTLYTYPASGLTSLYPLDPVPLKFMGKFERQLKHEKRFEIELTPLDDIEGLPDVDLLKIDVQGAESSIIAGGKRRLKNACAIITEIRFLPIYQDEPSWRELDQQLEDQGFQLHKFLHLAMFSIGNSKLQSLRPRFQRNQILDGDAVYIPSLLAIEEVSEFKLLKIAILADAVYSSYDLTLKCLDEICRRGLISQAQIDQYFTQLPPQVKA